MINTHTLQNIPGLPKIRQGWEPEGGTLHLFDSFEPYDQTRLEMSLGKKMSVSGKTPGKTLGKTPGKMPGKILELLATTPTLTIAELASLIGKSNSAVERAIRKLRESGRLKRIGPDKGGHWEVIDD